MRPTVVISRKYLAKRNVDRNSGRPNTAMDYDTSGFLSHLDSGKEEIKASMRNLLKSLTKP